jgi:carboxynorspermidine decarboxylase
MVETLRALEEGFSDYLKKVDWLNLGGGHLMTRTGYDVSRAVSAIKDFRRSYPHLRIFIEPGSAIAWDAGVLVSTVLDIVETEDLPVAMLDVSFAAHMPDCLEMPYRPEVFGASNPGRDTSSAGDPYIYRLGGSSCLAGDVVGQYGFSLPLSIGQKLIFLDMGHYTMVKTNTFNGVNLPSIAISREDGRFDVVKSFGYESFKSRL